MGFIQDDDACHAVHRTARSATVMLLNISKGIHRIGGIVGGILQITGTAQYFLFIGQEVGC